MHSYLVTFLLAEKDGCICGIVCFIANRHKDWISNSFGTWLARHAQSEVSLEAEGFIGFALLLLEASKTGLLCTPQDWRIVSY